jgi:LysM repeat protein
MRALVFATAFRNLAAMLRRLSLGIFLALLPFVSSVSGQVEMANLREDVRGLNQRVSELMLRVEQLERENSDLKSKAAAAERSAVTLNQLNDALADLNRTLRAAIASSRTETLEVVSGQIKELGKQTNTAIDSLAKGMATRPVVQTEFSEDYPKEGVKYTVQKGDSLATIAKKFGARQQDIINANKLPDASRIQVGQTLFIPGGK